MESRLVLGVSILSLLSSVLCQTASPKICENTTETEKSKADDVLKNGQEKVSRLGNREFGYFYKNKVTFYPALCTCQLWNGTLAMIKDRATLRHVNMNMPKAENCTNRSFFIIGLRHLEDLHDTRDPEEGSSSLMQDPMNNTWVWLDETPLNFSHWKPPSSQGNACSGEPNGDMQCSPTYRHQHSPFVQMSNCPGNNLGFWFDKHAASMWYPMCQRSSIELSTTTEPSETTTKTQVSTRPTQTTTASTTTTTTTTTTTIEPTTTPMTTKTTTTKVLTTTRTTATSPTTTASTTTKDQTSTKTTKNTTTKTTEKLTTTPPTTTTSTRTTTTKELTTTSTTTKITTARTKSASTVNPTTTTETIALLSTLPTNPVSSSISRNISKEMDDVLSSMKDNFSISSWESEGSRMLARLMLSQSSTPLTFNVIPDVTIKMLKIRPGFLRNASQGKDITVTFNSGSSDEIRLDPKVLQSLPNELALVAASFGSTVLRKNNLSKLSPLSLIDEKQSKSKLELSLLPTTLKVLSVSVFHNINSTDHNGVVKSSVPVKTVFDLEGDSSLLNVRVKQNRQITSKSERCVFLKTNELGQTSWLQEGCNVFSSSRGVVTCRCNHTTSFGVIFVVESIKVPSNLNLFMTILEVLSVVALAVTVSLLLWLRKRLNRDRTWIQINLSASLLLLHFFFLMGSVAANEEDPRLCEAFTVLSQYFVLTSGLWMLLEGVVLCLKTGSKAMNFSVKRSLLKLLLVAWGLPFLYVLVCATVGLYYGIYMDVSLSYDKQSKEHAGPKYDRCWLGQRTKYIYTVIAPLALIFAVTFCLMVKAAVSINEMTKESIRLRPSLQPSSFAPQRSRTSTRAPRPPRKEQLLTQIRRNFHAILMLLPVLGVPWFLAFLVNIPGAEVPFLVIHGLVNGLQGVFVFLVYCVKSNQFRLAIKLKWKQLPSTTQSFTLNRSSGHAPTT